MSQLDILSILVRGGLSPIGACAVGGNMMAESNMQSNIAQRGTTKLSDDDYTAAADANAIDFVHDSVGYGLCQWTYYSRKENLKAYAKLKGVSVGNEAMQTEFCLKELKEEYAELYKYLCSTKLLYEAAARVCKEYERPAVNNIQARAAFGDQLYMQYGEKLKAIKAGNLVFVPDINVGNKSDKTSDDDAEPSSYIMGEIINGTAPESEYMAALLKRKGYDVLWYGLNACIAQYKSDKGLTSTAQVWESLIGGGK